MIGSAVSALLFASLHGKLNFPSDLSAMSTKDLLRITDRVYAELECEHPQAEALAWYQLLTLELEARQSARQETAA